MERRLPAALVVGLVSIAVSSIVFSLLAQFVLDGHSRGEWVFHIRSYVGVANALLVFAGALALRDAVGSRRPIATLAAAAALVVLAWQLYAQELAPIWTHLSSENRFDRLRSIDKVMAWVVPIANTTLFVAVAAVGARRDRPHTLAAVAGIAVLSLVRVPIPLIGDLLPLAGTGVVIRTVMTAVIVALVIASALPGSARTGTRWTPAERGLRRAATAIAWRTGLALAFIPLLLLVVQTRSLEVAKLSILGLLIGGVIAGIVAALSFLQASRADADGAPRHRLAVAGGALAAGVAFDVLGVANAWIALYGKGELIFDQDRIGAEQWLVPAIALAGTVMFLSALGAIARTIPTLITTSGDRVRGIGAITVGTFAVSLWIQHEAMTGRSGGLAGIAVISLIALGVGICCTVAIVNMTREVATALGGMPSVPTAVARERDPG